MLTSAFIRSACLLLLCLLSVGEAQNIPKLSCGTCKGTGLLPCTGKEHDPKKLCGMTTPHHCDVVYRAPCCAGLMKIPCNRCKDPGPAAALEADKAERRAWVDAQSAWGKECAIQFVNVETEHFLARWSIPRWRVGNETLGRNKASHLFIKRCEDVAVKFEKLTGSLPAQKQAIYFTDSGEENMKVTLVKMGGGRRSTFRFYGLAGQVVQWPDPIGGMDNDEGYHAHTVHNAAHLLTQASVAFQMKLAPWLDEGMAHWFEREIFGKQRTYCFHEVQAKDSWQDADWKKKMYGEVFGNDEDNFASVVTRDLDRLTYRDRAHGWSFVDYLAKGDAEKFKTFFGVMKRKNDTKTALDEAYGISMATFHQNWRAWVLKNYATK